MSEGIVISNVLQAKLDQIETAARELFEKQEQLQEEFQQVLNEIQQAAEEAAEAEENDGFSASELFQEDPLFDECHDIASNLGGKVGGDYVDSFEFWIPSNC